jgi:hypothetical protein
LRISIHFDADILNFKTINLTNKRTNLVVVAVDVTVDVDVTMFTNIIDLSASSHDGGEVILILIIFPEEKKSFSDLNYINILGPTFHTHLL